LWEVVRMGVAGSAGPRPNGSGVLFEEELVFVGENNGVYDPDAGEKDITT
jgi:hypothetical protein